MYENMQTKYEVIDGANWAVNPFPAKQGGKILVRLFKVLGQSFSVILEAGDVEGGISRAIDMLSENIDKDDVIELCALLVSATTKDGAKVNFDNEFAARYDVLFKVVAFVVKANYGSFFPQTATAE